MSADGSYRQPIDPNSTLGKLVTLPIGVVVRDVGPGRCNGKVDPWLRRCVADNGAEHVVVSRVVRELPETIRRASFGWRP
jgi:hypothetical protein